MSDEESLSAFMLQPAEYASRAYLPAMLPASHRLKVPPRTLANIAEAARERCMQREKDKGVSIDSWMAEEGLAELRGQLKDALTYIEVLGPCHLSVVYETINKQHTHVFYRCSTVVFE